MLFMRTTTTELGTTMLMTLPTGIAAIPLLPIRQITISNASKLQSHFICRVDSRDPGLYVLSCSTFFVRNWVSIKSRSHVPNMGFFWLKDNLSVSA